jgi:hypothetical protein
MPTEAIPLLVVSAIANVTSAALSTATTALSTVAAAAPAAATAAALHPAAAAALVPGGLGVGLSTSGFLGLFFLGALAALERLGIFNPAATPLAGASGGSLVGLSACLGVPTDTALAIARDMTRLCLPRGSCAGFLDAPVRRMLNATISAAVAETGELPLSVLTSPDGFGGWGSGGNFSSRGVAAGPSSALALRASASPEYWRVADALVAEKCAGRFHVMISELVRGGNGGTTTGATRPAEAGALVASVGGRIARPAAATTTTTSASSTPDLTVSIVGNGTQAALASSALSLVSDPLSGRQAAAAAASAADAALAGNTNAANATTSALVAVAAAAQLSRRRNAEAGVVVAVAANDNNQPQQSHAHWAAWPVSDFLSAADAVDAAAGSSFIPIFSGPSITTAVRGRPVADGMLVQSLPCPPNVKYCVRISAAMPGEALVQGTRPITNPDIAPGLRVPFAQTLRQWQARALTAPTFAVSEALVWLGEREAEAWAVEVGLATKEGVAQARAKGVAGAAARAAADAAGAAASAAGPAAARAAANATSTLAAEADDADVATVVTVVTAAEEVAAAGGRAAAPSVAVVPAKAAAAAAAAAADAAAVAAASGGGSNATVTAVDVAQQQQQQQPRAPLRKMLRMRA